jgi:hypothetical protein
LKARLLADADLRYSIVRGFRSRAPTADFLAARGVVSQSLDDPHLLALAADLGRVLVSHDRKTMPGHFYRFLEARESPGVILIPQLRAIGKAIEDLHWVWECMEADEFLNQITYLPLASSTRRRFEAL